MLKKINVKNYRRFEDVTIDLDDVVLIVGKNGTGKSSFVELLYKLREFILSDGKSTLVESLVSLLDLPRWKKSEYGNEETTFSIIWECDENTFQWDLTTQYNMRDLKCRVILEQLRHGSSILYSYEIELNNAKVYSDNNKEFEYPVDWSHSNLRLASRVNSNIRLFLEEMKKILPFYIVSEGMQDGVEDLDFRGNNFSKWFSGILKQDIEAVSSLLRSYKDFLPNCVRTSILDKTEELIIYERGGLKGDFHLRFSELSAGQKKLCIYYALFKLAPKGAVLVFDEFENHLSPVELIPLYQLIQEEKEVKDLQVIIVSHHHKTLNWYNDVALIFTLAGEPARVKILEKDEDSTVIEMMERGEE